MCTTLGCALSIVQKESVPSKPSLHLCAPDHRCWSGIKYSAVTIQRGSLTSIHEHQAMWAWHVWVSFCFVFFRKLSYFLKDWSASVPLFADRNSQHGSCRYSLGICLGHPLGFQTQLVALTVCKYVYIHTQMHTHTSERANWSTKFHVCICTCVCM